MTTALAARLSRSLTAAGIDPAPPSNTPAPRNCSNSAAEPSPSCATSPRLQHDWMRSPNTSVLPLGPPPGPRKWPATLATPMPRPCLNAKMNNPPPWWLTWPVAEVAATILPLFARSPWEIGNGQMHSIVGWCKTKVNTTHLVGRAAKMNSMIPTFGPSPKQHRSLNAHACSYARLAAADHLPSD